jgi:hypothetical protein
MAARQPADLRDWPRDDAGRPLMRCPAGRDVGHEPGHWWAASLRPAHPVEGVRFLYCPAPSPFGRSR